MLHQVVAAHEALLTERAAKLLLPRVGTVMAGQLIRSGKLLAAFRPCAWERPFSCVRPHVRLEVRRLAVHLVAALEVAVVLLGGSAGEGRSGSWRWRPFGQGGVAALQVAGRGGCAAALRHPGARPQPRQEGGHRPQAAPHAPAQQRVPHLAVLTRRARLRGAVRRVPGGAQVQGLQHGAGRLALGAELRV